MPPPPYFPPLLMYTPKGRWRRVLPIPSSSGRRMQRLTTGLRGATGNGLITWWKRMQSNYEAWRDGRDDLCSDVDMKEVGNTFDDAGSKCIQADPNACPRSVLIVPASGIADMRRRRERRNVAADAVMLDLTSCGKQGEGNHRDHIMQFLKAEETGSAADKLGRTRYILRVNSPEFDPDNGFLDMELVGLLGDRVEGVAFPAVTKRTFTFIKDYVHPSHCLWAIFDTPLSVLQAGEICGQGCYRYALVDRRELWDGTHLLGSAAAEAATPQGPGEGGGSGGDGSSNFIKGAGIFQGDFSISPYSLYTISQVTLAARAYGMYVMDGAFTDVSDSVGFRHDVRRCRSLGFDGKLVVRQAQIAPCHEVFTPTAEEILWAGEVQQRHQRQLAHRRGNDKSGSSSSGIGSGECDVAKWRRAASLIRRHREVGCRGRDSDESS